MTTTVESPAVSPVKQAQRSLGPATERLRNARQVCKNLILLFTEKGLTALAADVVEIDGRIAEALEQIAEGNIGR